MVKLILNRYSMTNCLYEASLQKIARDCKCIPTIVDTFVEGEEKLPSCQGPGKLCMTSILDDIGTERYISMHNVSMECLAPCHDQTHQFLVTSSAYPNKQSFHLGDDFCLILNKLRTSCANERRYTLDMEYTDLCTNIDLTRDLTCDQIRGLSSTSLQESILITLRKNVSISLLR